MKIFSEKHQELKEFDGKKIKKKMKQIRLSVEKNYFI